VAQAKGNTPFRLINGGVRDVAAGAAHAGTNAETQMLLIAPSNRQLRMLFTVAEGVYRVVAKRSAGISRLADLRGKKVVTPVNTSAHYHLVKTLASAGIDESDVTIVNVARDEMGRALIDGRADAISMWEPFAEGAVALLGADAIVFDNNGVYRELFSLYTTTDVLSDGRRRRELVTFVRAVLNATEAVRQKRPDVLSLVARNIMQPERLVASSWEHHRFPAAMPADMLKVLVEEEQWIAKRQKRSAMSKSELSAFIDTTVLDEARR